VKPVIIACFGDIALNIGGMFEKYLPVVMNVMDQAGKTKARPQRPPPPTASASPPGAAPPRTDDWNGGGLTPRHG